MPWNSTFQETCLIPQQQRLLKYFARCKVYMKTFSIQRMGESGLTSHAKGVTLQQRLKETSKVHERCRLPKPIKKIVIEFSCSRHHSPGTTVFREDDVNITLFFQILAGYCKFQLMFLDSEIVKTFACGERRCSYLCSFWLAPHFLFLLAERNQVENMAKLG